MAKIGPDVAHRPDLFGRPLAVKEPLTVGSHDVRNPYSAGMTDPNPATDPPTRVAIEFLTLWMGPDRQFAAEHIVEVLGPGDPGSSRVIAGLLNLSMILAFEAAKANGATDYRAWVGDYLRRISPDLPE